MLSLIEHELNALGLVLRFTDDLNSMAMLNELDCFY